MTPEEHYERAKETIDIARGSGSGPEFWESARMAELHFRAAEVGWQQPTIRTVNGHTSVLPTYALDIGSTDVESPEELSAEVLLQKANQRYDALREQLTDVEAQLDALDHTPFREALRQAVGTVDGEDTLAAVRRAVRERDELQRKFNQAGVDLAHEAARIDKLTNELADARESVGARKGETVRNAVVRRGWSSPDPFARLASKSHTLVLNAYDEGYGGRCSCGGMQMHAARAVDIVRNWEGEHERV